MFKRGFPLLLALACAFFYARSLFVLWQPQLCGTSVSHIIDSTRGWQWIDVALNSSFSGFPSSNPGAYRVLQQLNSPTFCDFRTDMVQVPPTAATPIIGDDMGLYYIGYLVRTLGFKHFFLAYMWTAILIHMLVLFAFCATVFRGRAWVAGLAVTWALVSTEHRPEMATLLSWGPWQPYGYAALFPLLLYVLLEYSRDSAAVYS